MRTDKEEHVMQIEIIESTAPSSAHSHLFMSKNPLNITQHDEHHQLLL
jgi:hypothetical protein